MIETKVFSSVILPLVLAFIMFGMGLSLTREDFKYIFVYPKGIITGLATQMIYLPLVAFALVYFAPLEYYYKVGIVLVAACPGGASSGLVVFLTGGNVAMSVSFTAINSFLTMLSIPFITNIALSLFAKQTIHFQMNIWDTLTHVFLITILPCMIGLFVHYKFENLARKVSRPMKIVLPILLAAAMLGAVLVEKSDIKILPSDYTDIFPYVLALNFLGLAGGYYIAKTVKLGNRNKLTVSMEVGLQNTGMAISIATSPFLLNDKSFAVPAAIYALFSFFTALLFAAWIKRKTLRAYLNRRFAKS